MYEYYFCLLLALRLIGTSEFRKNKTGLIIDKWLKRWGLTPTVDRDPSPILVDDVECTITLSHSQRERGVRTTMTRFERNDYKALGTRITEKVDIGVNWQWLPRITEKVLVVIKKAPMCESRGQLNQCRRQWLWVSKISNAVTYIYTLLG